MACPIISIDSLRSSPLRTPFMSIFISCPPMSKAIEKEILLPLIFPSLMAVRTSGGARQLVAIGFERVADLRWIAVHALNLPDPFTVNGSRKRKAGNKNQS